jgi:hypothetical protein
LNGPGKLSLAAPALSHKRAFFAHSDRLRNRWVVRHAMRYTVINLA